MAIAPVFPPAVHPVRSFACCSGAVDECAAPSHPDRSAFSGYHHRYYPRSCRRGVYVNFNMHPAAGVEFHEKAYPAIAAEVGIDPRTGATVAFDIANQTYAGEYSL